MVDEEELRKSVRVNLTTAINDARDVFRLSTELSLAVRDIAAKHNVQQPGKMVLVCFMTGYSMLKFTTQPWELEPKFWEAVRLAKEMYEAAGPKEKEQVPDEAGS